MVLTVIDGNTLRSLVLAGYNNLRAHVQEINDLNVFPVPDGDTGSNMKKTLENGVNNMKSSKSIGEVVTSLARGMLLGARGNSGVIFSQYFKGISNALQDKDEISVMDFAHALQEGHKTAYSAVVKPTEGTILTVAREGIDFVIGSVNEETTLNILLIAVFRRMQISLKETPEKLAVLKEAGVVDSGGAGLIAFYDGMIKYLEGEDADFSLEEEDEEEKSTVSFDPSLFNADSVLEYGYCTEFILQLQNAKVDISSFDIQTIISYLETIGDSIVAIKDIDIVKIHVHTKTPGLVINFVQQFGEFVTFKMENMAIQHNEVEMNRKEAKPHKKVGIVSVAQGDGIMDLFQSLGSDVVLNGGQTMNTSTEEFLDAFKEANADDIIVLPNNKNIILAAEQAAEICDFCKVHVIHSRSIAEGFFALQMALDSSYSAEEQIDSMNEGIQGVVTGEVTYSVRDTSINGVSCKKNDYIGILGKNMVAASKDHLTTTLAMIDKIDDIQSKQIVTIIYGQHASEEEANQIKAYIENKNQFIEVGVIDGKQDIYDFILGIY